MKTGAAFLLPKGGMYSNRYSNALQTQRLRQSRHRRPRGVIGSVTVNVPGDRNRRMTEQIRHCLDMHARLEPRRSRRMPQRMHPVSYTHLTLPTIYSV